ncbi:MAG TPA: Holliday junction branch migration protein RuvA [Candidatus Acidoferrales bacterium]|nr:Holliday junction branch migration protein RuvA [Candidatus Acidoferrales bacterium]
MFSRISGVLVERNGESAVVEAGGLGYDVVLPPCVAEKLPPDGERVTLEIYAVVNLEGSSGRFTYYGFTNAVEREFFEALLTVASVGPRTAARAFSLPMSAIAGAIDRGDHAFLRGLPGIGQQKARDIVAKLQGKVAKFLLIQDPPPPPAAAIPDFADEALAVLLQLEYRRPEAEAMIRETLEDDPGIRDAEALLAQMYRRRASKERP